MTEPSLRYAYAISHIAVEFGTAPNNANVIRYVYYITVSFFCKVPNSDF